MGKDYCCVTNCHNFSGRVGKFGNNVTLHKLPKDSYTRRAWIRSISRKNWKPTTYTRVCSDHFENGSGPNSLNRNKVPTENLPQKRPSSTTPRKSPGDRSRPLMTASDCDTSLEHHSYAKNEDCTQTHSATDNHGGSLGIDSKETQTCQPLSENVGTTSSMPEIVIETIQHSTEMMLFYTGLPNYETFNALFESLVEQGADKLSTESIGNMNRYNLGRKRKLRRIDEFLLVMMRLRLGLLVKDLEYRFKISSSAVSKIFNSWILFMCECMQSLVFLQDLEVLKLHVPKCFEKFSDTRVVLDCTEIFIQSPSSLENKSLTFSNYKSHDTFKALIGVSMTGAVVFVSKLWPGSASDVEITRNSGLLQHLKQGDAVMVDKGFIHLSKDLKPKGVKLYCPPFKSEFQFSKSEVETTRRIASARIHVERKMEQIKNFRLLQGVLPLALSNFADQIFFVCVAMTNLLPPLVSE